MRGLFIDEAGSCAPLAGRGVERPAAVDIQVERVLASGKRIRRRLALKAPAASVASVAQRSAEVARRAEWRGMLQNG